MKFLERISVVHRHQYPSGAYSRSWGGPEHRTLRLAWKPQCWVPSTSDLIGVVGETPLLLFLSRWLAGKVLPSSWCGMFLLLRLLQLKIPLLVRHGRCPAVRTDPDPKPWFFGLDPHITVPSWDPEQRTEMFRLVYWHLLWQVSASSPYASGCNDR